MKRAAFILLLILTLGGIKAQVIFKVSVPAKPIVVDEPFSVQYVLEEGNDKKDQFFPPDFKDFRVVSGPYINGGSAQTASGAKKLKNIVFTLVISRPGKYIIPAASASVNGIFVKSNNASVEVLSKQEANEQQKEQRLQAANEDYFLRPGEDPYEKMQKNLFIKVAVNKRTCYAGEPVIATYKLYSRLESKSDIIKNPGFYGFTVQDMVNLDDKVLATEMIDGRSFDVHTIRKVQLFPFQAGSYSIDEMEVQNKVTFSKSFVRKRTEQEIEEGVYDHPDDLPMVGNTVEYENSMRTEPIAIHVQPVPVNNQPSDYNGATGNFLVTSILEKNELGNNEEGNLLVTISGKGNFTQLSAPVIEWPKGIEGFDAVIKDELDKTQSPLTGKRVFRFPFTMSGPGIYTLPSIHFSFFNPDSNNYKAITTKPVKITVGNRGESKPLVVEKISNSQHINQPVWIIAFVLVGVLAIVLLVLKRKARQVAPVTITEKAESASIDDALQAARILLPADNRSFYVALRNGIWIFLDQQLGLKGSGMNKSNLRSAMQATKISAQNQDELLTILTQCETGIFTNVESTLDKKELFDQTKSLLASFLKV